ncbi:general odorant-binding protein 56d-like isoform X2 [Belonocnema kinseyi]|uniref:general odorant-binding protein 56d-like isoform X2 n=1 Tax=Belonocnema kinseyi TaxID=2817044 RepID=UPI00143DFDE5|nr:general odorant-binding protein 56d-like isoform X2 [Belonocnema kinseyi]XP_033210141.1 general odorant-binding protein 56d-like isoform X2 [Belonocnema kinseyi]
MLTCFQSISVPKKMDINALRKATMGLKPGCVKASGVAEELADGVTRGEYPPDPNLMCYLKCLLQKLKGVKNGKISVEMMTAQTRAIVEESVADQIISAINACGHFTDQEDICKAAYDYSKCYWEFDRTVCFFP